MEHGEACHLEHLPDMVVLESSMRNGKVRPSRTPDGLDAKSRPAPHISLYFCQHAFFASLADAAFVP